MNVHTFIQKRICFIFPCLKLPATQVCTSILFVIFLVVLYMLFNQYNMVSFWLCLSALFTYMSIVYSYVCTLAICFSIHTFHSKIRFHAIYKYCKASELMADRSNKMPMGIVRVITLCIWFFSLLKLYTNTT